MYCMVLYCILSKELYYHRKVYSSVSASNKLQQLPGPTMNNCQVSFGELWSKLLNCRNQWSLNVAISTLSDQLITVKIKYSNNLMVVGSWSVSPITSLGSAYEGAGHLVSLAAFSSTRSINKLYPLEVGRLKSSLFGG